MSLREFLAGRFAGYGDKVAFTGSGATYRRLAELMRRGTGEGRLTAVCGDTREDQALELLRVLGEGNVAVPSGNDYGEAAGGRIRRIVGRDAARYPGLSFVMFTSGTTGRPKGVMLTEDNILSNLRQVEAYAGLTPRDEMLIARPLAHVAVITAELLLGLCCGLTLSFYEDAFQPKRLAARLDEGGYTVFSCTPTMFRHLARYLEGKSLRRCFLSGEPLSAEFARQIAAQYPRVAFSNGYGLTECSPRVSALLPEDFTRKAGSAGRPLAGTEVKLENGEICVRSQSVMAGYYRNASATRQKLRSGWLHTGDAGRVDEDGYLYVLGRLDGMIIRGGVNIYPAEIERVAQRCPGVEGCLAYGEPDANFGQRICLKYGGDCSERRLREYLIARLPPHLLPTLIVKADGLAVTPSGKVRRP